MSENDFELRGIAWSKAFPFIRLFQTFTLARDMRQLTLGLACVLTCYIGGRVLDRIWLGAESGVAVAPAGQIRSEIDAYATRGARAFEEWKSQNQLEYDRFTVEAVRRWTGATTQEAAESLLASQTARELLDTQEHRDEVAEIRRLIDERLSQPAAESEDANAPAAAEQPARGVLEQHADRLRLALSGNETAGLVTPAERARAVEAFADPQDADQQIRIRAAADRAGTLAELDRREPAGPFAALLKYQMGCFAGAIQGVCRGHWGLSGGALDAEPAMLGSILSAGKGMLWLVTQKPWYAIFYGLILLIVFAFFGGAICRSVAMRAARQESVELRTALGFAREKYSGLLLAPIVPAGILVVGAVAMFLGGLVGAIPYLGELLTGLFYGLALLLGFGLALVLLGTVLGFNLLWPTIAAEGSDAFDAVQHALGYVGQRPWYAGFYAFVLLLSGGVCFVMVRLIALLLFKVTHVVCAAGMSMFGAWSSSQTATIGKLDAMWHMPAWSELPLLPTAGGVPFWGTFGNAPLNGSESVAMFLIACWVFLCVGLLGAFLVSFYFAGSTQMYLLLRYHVDGVDWDEVYFEEDEADHGLMGTDSAAADPNEAAGDAPVSADDGEPPESPPAP